MRRLASVLAALAAATTTGCGSTSSTRAPDLTSTCRSERAALVRLSPVTDLGDAERALRELIALERRVLTGLRGTALSGDPLATQLRLSIEAATRSLRAIRGDAQRTMDPLRTGQPSARRAIGSADTLLRVLCARSRA